MLASLELDFGSATSALDLARPPAETTALHPLLWLDSRNQALTGSSKTLSGGPSQ